MSRHKALAVFWLAFGVVGVFVAGIRESIPVLFFISVYANVAGHWSALEADTAKREARDRA